MQAFWPASDEVPSGHGEHAVAPASGAKVPAAQAVQPCPGAVDEPGEHVVQAFWPLPELDPAGQAAQATEPVTSANVFSGQSKQMLAPGLGAYVPGAQSWHWLPAFAKAPAAHGASHEEGAQPSSHTQAPCESQCP